MSELSTLEALQELHRSLLAACEKRLDDFSDVIAGLEAAAPDFRAFLTKSARSTDSRKTIQSGKIKYEDVEYQLNSSFQELCLQLADFLDLDELEAAKLLLDSEQDTTTLGRPLIECGVIRFHQRRKYLLDCIRQILVLSGFNDLPDPIFEMLQQFAQAHLYGEDLDVVQGKENKASASPAKKLVPNCLDGIQETRRSLQQLAERIVSQTLVSAGAGSHIQETMEYTRASLVQQHEVLCMILSLAVGSRHATVSDFQSFLALLKKADKYDNLLAHLFPAIGAFMGTFASPESNILSIAESRKLNASFCKPSDSEVWALPYLAAVVRAWWIVEYGAWFAEGGPPELRPSEIQEEETLMNEAFMEALKDGALDMLLSVLADVQPVDWLDPAKSGMRRWLQRNAPSIVLDVVPFSDFFRTALMLQVEGFIDAFITNHPDLLRKLRVEEDEQRQLSHNHAQDLNLERFLMIIAFTYDGRPEAGSVFWDDPESNLSGFMQWASRRASTPLLCTFCEALLSVADNEECATEAHNFLNDKSQQWTGKMRQSQSLTWKQIFKELLFFSQRIRERPHVPQSHVYRGGKHHSETTEAEPESAMMLESYMRLITRLATRSAEARTFLLKTKDFTLADVLFQLAASPVPPRLRGCTFKALEALMTQKEAIDCGIMWSLLEQWMTGEYQQNSKPSRHVEKQESLNIMTSIFAEIGNGFEEPNAMIQFLTTLVTPSVNDGSGAVLPFSPDLGSKYREPGIDLYVDFVLGHVFALKSNDLVGEPTQLRVLRLSCLEFALTCLTTFRENLITMGIDLGVNLEKAFSDTDISTYICLHPFARVMEWMFNDTVIKVLLSTIHQDPTEVGNAAPDSPLILGILRAVEIITKVLDLQSTYLEVVRKFIRLNTKGRQEVSNTSYGGFEDGLLSHLSLVVDLGNYCGMGYPDLTLACLKLLEKISTSSRIINAWSPGLGQVSHRNKAIVALEAHGDGDTIAGALISELTDTLDFVRQAEAPNYQIKVYILDFLHSCLRATPTQPTIAHFLLGFKCASHSLSVQPGGTFDSRTSLFHSLLRVLLELPFGDDTSVRFWLVNLKYKIMRVLQALWSSPISSSLVIAELRANDILFHLLLRELTITPELAWDDRYPTGAEFLIETSGECLVHFLSTRAMMLEYVSKELCGVSCGEMPALKRRIFDALNGKTRGDDNELMDIPSIFELFDFMQDAPWYIPEPPFEHCKDINRSKLLVQDADGNQVFSLAKAREILQLRKREPVESSQLVTAENIAKIDEEESRFLSYLTYLNRLQQVESAKLRVLRGWTNVLVMMIDLGEFQGSTRISFFLQSLQAILPSFELYANDSPDKATLLAKVAMVLLYRIDFSEKERLAQTNVTSDTRGISDKVAAALNLIEPEPQCEPRTVGNLLSDKLYQLFQICLESLAKWVPDANLRSIYYAMCYRYLVTMVDDTSSSFSAASTIDPSSSMALSSFSQSTRQSLSSSFPTGGPRRALLAVLGHGERLLGIICDDAYGSSANVQTAALTLLRAIVMTGTQTGDHATIETLNRLNFIGVVVDSLRDLLNDWLAIISLLSPASGSFGHDAGLAPSWKRPKLGNNGTGSFSAEVCVPADVQLSNLLAKLALLLAIAQTKPGAKLMLQAGLLRAIETSRLFAADPELQLDRSDLRSLALHYGLLVRVARIMAAAVTARGQHNVPQARAFLASHRDIVLHVLKRSVGIGMPVAVVAAESGSFGVASTNHSFGGGSKRAVADAMTAKERSKHLEELQGNIQDLAEVLMVLITATDFVDFDSKHIHATTLRKRAPGVFT